MEYAETLFDSGRAVSDPAVLVELILDLERSFYSSIPSLSHTDSPS
jgi:hypothetical protein